MKRIAGRKLYIRDEERNKRISVRVGYAYLPSFASEDPPIENRLFFEATGRLKMPAEILLHDRNRVDFRWIDGEDSARYRSRIKAEREFQAGHFHFNTYASAEFYYDNRSNNWSRNEYAAGAEFPFLWKSVLEFYYTRQDNKTSGSTDVNGIGATLQIYLGSSD